MSAAVEPRLTRDEPHPAGLPEWARGTGAVRTAQALGTVALLAADFSIVYGCFFLSYWTRTKVLAQFTIFQGRGEPASYESYLFFVTIYLLVFALLGLYHRRLSWLDESTLTLRACFYSTAGAFLFSSLVHITELFSRTVVLLASVLIAVSLPLVRFLVKSALGRWKPWQQPVVLLGANANGLQAAEDITSDRTNGLQVVGIITDRPLGSSARFPVWQVRDQDQAIDFCQACGIRSFILCEDDHDHAGLLRRVRRLEAFAGNIKIATAQPGLHSLRMQSEVLRASHLFAAENPMTRPANRILKRALDIGAGLLLAVVFLPVFALVPVLIRLTSRGPVLFRQQRVGMGGARFWCLKFRTMYGDSSARLERILAEDECAREEFAESFKLRQDPRVTPVGGWLRRTSLDELPQLWNVLRGQMSLVGPRPVVPEEASTYADDLSNYFRAPCGLTGLWQISGRSDLSRVERVRLDLFYIRNWSIWLDLVILARTAWHILRPRGAY